MLAEYKGYSKDEAIELILNYIRLQIRNKCILLESKNKGNKEGPLAEAVKLLSENELAEGIDYSVDPNHLSEKDIKSIKLIDDASKVVKAEVQNRENQMI